jgi:glutamate 5-kinase
MIEAKRIVIKVGSSTLTGRDGAYLDRELLDRVVDLIASLKKDGKEVVLVSSGAIASGLSPLGLESRPKDVTLQQAVASVGQGLLIRNYFDSFARHNVIPTQVLLTAEDVMRRSHYLNVRGTLLKSIELGLVPVINENDSVAFAEIRFGDNDRISALVSHIVNADLLLIVTDVDALYNAPPKNAGSKRIARVEDFASLDALDITGSDSKVGSGGMITKIEAARIAASAGIATILTDLEHAARALEGGEVGTFFAPATEGARNSRRLWLAHASEVRGKVHLDEGATVAIIERGSSLLPAGVTRIEGNFLRGDAVELVNSQGEVIARGLVGYDADEVPQMIGKSTKELSQNLGEEYGHELIHRDEMVLL